MSDYSNNRILVWNSVPTTNGEAANVAIGQPDLTSNYGVLSSSQLSYPSGMETDSQGRLFIADSNNGRIMIWNSFRSRR